MALLRLALLAAAAALIVLGALNGGALDMLQKAVKICTECVGLG
ncbi:MAG: thioredoxin [Clostridia bacterium]|nr:thioredoxin [Clostridia bacterium]